MLRVGFGEALIKKISIMNIASEGDDKLEFYKAFSGKTIAGMVYDEMFQNHDSRFDWLRKLLVTPRVKTFWWRILWQAIPNNSWLFRRGLADS